MLAEEAFASTKSARPAGVDHHVRMVVFERRGPEAAPVLARLWAQAEARRIGGRGSDSIDVEAVEAVRGRLDQSGAVALVGIDAGRAVAGCFATQAVDAGGQPVSGRAHVSGIAVAPDRWGAGVAHSLLRSFEALLVECGYDKAQLHVLETNRRARYVYESLGWALIRTGEPHPAGPHAVYEKVLQQPT